MDDAELLQEFNIEARQRWAAELRKLPYGVYLRHHVWRTKRLAALQRADFTCEGCGATDCALQVHHTPEAYAALPNETLEQLRVYCNACHLRATPLKRGMNLRLKNLATGRGVSYNQYNPPPNQLEAELLEAELRAMPCKSLREDSPFYRRFWRLVQAHEAATR